MKNFPEAYNRGCHRRRGISHAEGHEKQCPGNDCVCCCGVPCWKTKEKRMLLCIDSICWTYSKRCRSTPRRFFQRVHPSHFTACLARDFSVSKQWFLLLFAISIGFLPGERASCLEFYEGGVEAAAFAFRKCGLSGCKSGEIDDDDAVVAKGEKWEKDTP